MDQRELTGLSVQHGKGGLVHDYDPGSCSGCYKPDHWDNPTRPVPSEDAMVWLAGLQRRIDDGSVWKTPPVREQLADVYERLGLE